MAAPSYAQIQAFGDVTDRLTQAAVDEFMSEYIEGMTYEEVMDEAVRIAAKYEMYGKELGAQWYDYCCEVAGVDAEPAEVTPTDAEWIASRVDGAMKAAPNSPVYALVNRFMQDIVNEAIRETGNANLWRDYERGLCPGRWARVPVGDTCSWCMMLASNGAWYLTEETALGTSPGHYHSNCDCKAVYHSDANDIRGYTQLEEYKKKYYHAENLRSANSNPNNDYEYPDELRDRIAKAKRDHERKVQEAIDGGYDEPPRWTKYNEDLIIMRYEYGLK